MATPRIVRIGPVPRQEGLQTPGLLTPSEWIDARVLAAGVAETYTLPTDASGNKGTILRLASNGTSTLYVKWDGTAAVPAADVTDGTASSSSRIDTDGMLLVAPNSAYALSLICASNLTLTIEVWN